LSKVECALKDILMPTYERLDKGLLLASAGKDGRTNIMTVGWGLIGVLWREPVFMVAVRPSRYTHGLIEETGEFTVNVPKQGMGNTVTYCGTVSGREHDKFKECGEGLSGEPLKRSPQKLLPRRGLSYALLWEDPLNLQR